jgi:hypothetical protein
MTSPFFKGRCPKDREVLLDLIKLWQFAEHSDARRQSTYFKSRYQNKAIFFDITSVGFENKIFKLVAKWYNK